MHSIYSRGAAVVAVVLLAAVLFSCDASAGARPVAKFTIALVPPFGTMDIPVRVDLDDVTSIADSALSLVEVRGTKRTPVPFQIERSERRTLHWLLHPGYAKRTSYAYELVRRAGKTFTTIDATIGDSALIMHAGGRKLLRYNFATTTPPAGVDTLFKRSGYIHPLWTPHGQVLTRIQPPDHYHHFGIWNPWTHVLFKGDTVDFWNIGGGKGTVRFAKFAAIVNGSVFSSCDVLHEHVVLKKDGAEEVALNELQTMKIYKPEEHQDYYIADLIFRMNCAAEFPVKLLEYRYGGLGWRATEQWNSTNSDVLTSEHKTRKNADGSTARWCIVQGALGADDGGIVMMSHPDNFNHPEPLRIWPENQNGRGDVFANFSPTKNMDWLLAPGTTYVLKYRLLVFNGRFTKERAEIAWRAFAHAPAVSVVRY